MNEVENIHVQSPFRSGGFSRAPPSGRRDPTKKNYSLSWILKTSKTAKGKF